MFYTAGPSPIHRQSHPTEGLPTAPGHRCTAELHNREEDRHALPVLPAPRHQGSRLPRRRGRLLDPPAALLLAVATRRSMRWLLHAAGISTGGIGGALRVKGMVAVWLWTVRAWRSDESEDLSATMAAVDAALHRGGQVAEGFGDPWNNLVTGNPWTLYWIPFVRGAVSGIDQRSRYIETLADIERTSLDYYATIRSLYRQRRAALIRHEQEENLPPKAGFTRREDRGLPSVIAKSAAGPAGISEQ